MGPGVSKKKPNKTVTAHLNDDVPTTNEWGPSSEDDRDLIRPETPPLPKQSIPDRDQHYDSYVDAVLAGDAEFKQISPEFYVVQGWDARNITSTVA